MPIAINIFNESKLKNLPNIKLKEALKLLCESEGLSEGIINIIYIDDIKIRELNKKFLNHDYPTDVITFSFGEDSIEAEIYMSVETALKQSKEYNDSLRNELIRLAIHGGLHIAGYDDDTEDGRSIMHNLENKYLYC